MEVQRGDERIEAWYAFWQFFQEIRDGRQGRQDLDGR
jgi:hypothetical protein